MRALFFLAFMGAILFYFVSIDVRTARAEGIFGLFNKPKTEAAEHKSSGTIYNKPESSSGAAPLFLRKKREAVSQRTRTPPSQSTVMKGYQPVYDPAMGAAIARSAQARLQSAAALQEEQDAWDRNAKKVQQERFEKKMERAGEALGADGQEHKRRNLQYERKQKEAEKTPIRVFRGKY